MDETLVNFGSELKAIGTTDDGAMKFGAWLVLFGDKDNTDASPLRDYFTKSTDFDIEDGDKTTIYYNHGLDPELKRRKLGTATLSIKDAGVWMEGQLKARDEYETKIQDLIRKGKLGASSGVPSHLVERKTVGNAHEILLWPLGKDASLTPTPAEHRTYVTSLKSLMTVEEVEHEIKRANGEWITINGAHVRVGSAQHRAIVGGSEKPSDTEVLAALDHHGITSNAAREAILHAHANGHIGSHDQLHAIARSTKESGGSEGHAVSAINRHGEGGNYSGPTRGGDSPRDSGRDDSRDDSSESDSGSEGREDRRQGGRRETDTIPDPPDSMRDAAASASDVDKAAEKHKLDTGQKKKIKGLHSSGKIKTHLDLVNAIRGVIRDARSNYQRGKQMGEAAGDTASGKSLEIDGETYEFKQVEIPDELDTPDTPELKQLIDLESSLPDGLDFNGHSLKVLAANGELLERIESLADMRCVKSNRRWSADKYRLLMELSTKAIEWGNSVKSIAESHAPRSEMVLSPEAQKALLDVVLLEANLTLAESAAV